MKYNRTYNFSAGPAMMPEPVLEEIRDEMMNYRGSGMCCGSVTYLWVLIYSTAFILIVKCVVHC